ncbi:MAG: cytochrome c oxidase assembly protein [Chloroflexi bacterium]|nr:cytochrome c oxidase assembly protein [Chloroflexota bacterium]
MIQLGDVAPAMWHWQPLLLFLLAGVTIVYVRGWQWIQSTSEPLLFWRPLAFFSGLFLLALVLISPLYHLAQAYLFARVSQHILLLAPVPALLLVGDPVPVLKVGLPWRWQQWLERYWGEGTKGRGRVQQLTPVGAIWVGFIAAFTLWYDPILHNAARYTPWLRTLELTSMFMAGLFYWWIITQASPRLHELPNFWLRVIFAALGALPLKLLGGMLMFSESHIYVYPANEIQVMDVSGERAQQLLAGVTVWFFGGVTFTNAAFLLIRGRLQQEEDKPMLSISALSTHERMIAPGLGGDKR